MAAGLAADLGVAVAAFVGTNIDNGVVTMAMVAAAPPGRATRIASGQVMGFVLLVVVAAATAIALFEFSTRAIGLLGLVPLALGLRGLFMLRPGAARTRLARRAVGGGVITAALVTIGAGGDNMAVYIPLLKLGGVTRLAATTAVFALGEVVLTYLVLRAAGHPRIRQLATRAGVVVAPVLYCAIGLLILWEAGTIAALR